MAEGKKSFIAYSDWDGMFQALPDDVAGKLIKHVFSYVNDRSPKSDDYVITALFEQIRAALKRDLEKWDNERKGRSSAGKKGMEKRWSKSTEPITNDNSVIPVITKITDSVNDNVIVNDTVIDNTVPNHQHQSHETFAEKLFTQNGELDKQNLELQLNPRRLLTKKDCEEFNLHLFTEKKHHVHWSAYLSHLRNWLNTRPDNSKKQNYGKTNEQNPRLGRLDSKTIQSVLNRRKNSNPSQPDSGGEEAEWTQVDQ